VVNFDQRPKNEGIEKSSTEGLVGKWTEDEALKMTLAVPNWARGNLFGEPTFA